LPLPWLVVRDTEKVEGRRAVDYSMTAIDVASLVAVEIPTGMVCFVPPPNLAPSRVPNGHLLLGDAVDPRATKLPGKQNPRVPEPKTTATIFRRQQVRKTAYYVYNKQHFTGNNLWISFTFCSIYCFLYSMVSFNYLSFSRGNFLSRFSII
jgi:hypothetical protein